MSLLQERADVIFHIYAKKPDPIKTLKYMIVRETSKVQAAILILVYRKFTDAPAPAWGSFREPHPEPKPQPEPVSVPSPVFMSKYKDIDPPKLKQSTGYRDGDGSGSCLVIAPWTVTGHDGFKCNVKIARKYHKQFDLR